MSIRKRFNQAFEIEDTIEDEKKRFVNRTNQLIFQPIDTNEPRDFKYNALFEVLCFKMGLNVSDMWQKYHRKNDYLLDDKEYAPEIRSLTGDDFDNTLLVLCILYSCFEKLEGKQEWLSEKIEIILSHCTRDIGVRWKDGLFYASGAEELDRPLIEDTLTWLNKYPNEKKDLQNALKYYIEEEKSLPEVIKSCYSAIEGISRKILGNNKTLDNNKDELLRKISLSDGWKSIIANYITYAHDFRHASEKRHEIPKQEAEGYLYMTGLLIRLIIESK